MPLVNPIPEINSVGSRISIMGDRDFPAPGWRMYKYGPQVQVVAPHGGVYQKVNYLQDGMYAGAAGSQPINSESDYDGYRIATTINGKNVISWLFILDTRPPSIPPNGQIEIAAPLGRTLNDKEEPLWPRLGWCMTVDGRQVDPWVAANDFGGLVWPEKWLEAKEKKTNPDLASTLADESKSPDTQSSSSDGGGLIETLAKGFLAFKVAQAVMGKGGKRK